MLKRVRCVFHCPDIPSSFAKFTMIFRPWSGDYSGWRKQETVLSFNSKSQAQTGKTSKGNSSLRFRVFFTPSYKSLIDDDLLTQKILTKEVMSLFFLATRRFGLLATYKSSLKRIHTRLRESDNAVSNSPVRPS